MEPRPAPDPLSRSEPSAAMIASAHSALVVAAFAGGELEPAVAAHAVEAGGPGFTRAWLLAWDPQELHLIGVSTASAIESERSGQREAARAWSRVTLAEARLDRIVLEAWTSGAAVAGGASAPGLPWYGAARIGAVALRRGGRRWGVLVGAWTERGARPEELAALQSEAALATAVLDARDGHDRARRREDQTTALAEFVRNTAALAHRAEAFHRIVRLAALGAAATGAAVWLGGEDGGSRLEVTHGPAGRRERAAAGLGPLVADAMARQRPVVLDRVTDDPRLTPEHAAALTSVIVIPLLSQGRALGALAAYDRTPAFVGAPAVFDAGDVAFLDTLAGLAAHTVELAERDAAGRRLGQREHELRVRLVREERLAALGESALRTAQEARHPLASIAAFARRVHRALAPDDVQREALEIVLREVARLERMMAETLADAPPEPARLTVERVNQSVQEVLQAAGETLVRRRIRLLKRLAPDLPALLIDPERLRQVIGNLLSHALEAVPIGGRVRVESRRAGAYVQVEIGHDGPRAPGDLMEQLFQAFASGPSPQTNVGLAVAQRIIRDHGGEIRVRAEGDWSNVVSFTLPVAENQDRRHPGVDRRQRRADRRGAAGA